MSLFMSLQAGEEKFVVERQQWLVCFPENLRVPLPQPELPLLILNTLAAVAVRTQMQMLPVKCDMKQDLPVCKADMPYTPCLTKPRFTCARGYLSWNSSDYFGAFC